MGAQQKREEVWQVGTAPALLVFVYVQAGLIMREVVPGIAGFTVVLSNCRPIQVEG